MDLLTATQAQELLAPHHPRLWKVAAGAVGRFDALIGARPEDMRMVGDGSAAHLVNDFMRGEAREVFARVDGVAVQDLAGDLLVVALDALDGSVVLRFNKNGEDAQRRGNDTARWGDYESHSLNGFQHSTHLVVGYDLSKVDGAVLRVTVTCPTPAGTYWSYNITDSQAGVVPVDTQQPLGGMPPVAPATLTSTRAGKRKADREVT